MMEKNAESSMKHIMERSIQSGISGAAAMGINVATLMWMRTTINYQYVHGTGTLQTKLLANGFQGLMFSVLWKYIDEQLSNKK